MTTEINIKSFHIRSNLFDPSDPDTKQVPLHWHTVPHVFQVKRGTALVEVLSSFDGDVTMSRVVCADDEIDVIEIEAMTFHRITLLEPGTQTKCWFSNLVPVALLEQRGKDAEFDMLLEKLIAIAEQKWRVVVKDQNGRWAEGNH